MNRHRAGIFLVAVALALLGAPGDAAAGALMTPWHERAPGAYPANQSSQWMPGQPAPFTLSGTMDVTFVLDGDGWTMTRAVVRCWLCSGGSCDESSGFGPASFVADLSNAEGAAPPYRRLQVPFELEFIPTALPGSETAGPYTSYYCNLGLAGRNDIGQALQEGGETLVVPRPFHPQGSPFRTASGAPLVVELSGIFP